MNLKKKLIPLWNYFAGVSPVLATKIQFRHVLGKKLDLKNPISFNEKQQWLKLYKYGNDPLVIECADKYRVREYIKECGCSAILNELYGAWDNVEDIDWESLPDQFVIKCNHGSGFNILCSDKKKLDVAAAKTKLDRWMKTPYGRYSVELIYEKISPMIIAERFITTADGKEPTDYKFFCSHGEVKFIYVMLGHDEVQDYFTADWEWLPVGSNGRPHAKQHMAKPPFFDEMVRYASLLSKPFPEVRVDFYYEENKIIFGELTFLTTGGLTKYNPPEFDEYFGKLFPPVSEM